MIEPVRKLLLVASCAGLLLGCGGDQPTLQSLSNNAIVLAFGDSLTQGAGAPSDKSYPAVLATLIARRVVNAGVSGEISAAGLPRLKALLEAQHYDLVILCHGGNDLLRKKNLARTAKNLEAMIDYAQQSGAEVVLIGVPKPGLFLGTADFYEKIAEDKQLVAEMDIIADVLGDAGLKSDAIHPNAKGYRRIAEAINTLLHDAGALN